MFKLKSNCKMRLGAFFFWKSDDFVVATKQSNVCGAKGVTKFGPQTLNLTVDMDTVPGLGGHQ